MRELLEFIFAVVLLVLAFKMTVGCLKVVLWIFGVIFLLSVLASLLT